MEILTEYISYSDPGGLTRLGFTPGGGGDAGI